MTKKKALAETRPVDPKKTLDYVLKARDGKKRDYIFSWSKARKCPHRQLNKLVMGGTWYLCPDCNWAMCITGAYIQPIHSMVIGGALMNLAFAKHFGSDALAEVLRRPIGQEEAKHQMPVLPEGMNLMEAARLLDEVDLTAPDGGVAQLKALQEAFWVSPKERDRRRKQLGPRADEVLGLEGAHDDDTQPGRLGAGAQGQKRRVGRGVPRVRAEEQPRAADGDSGEP